MSGWKPQSSLSENTLHRTWLYPKDYRETMWTPNHRHCSNVISEGCDQLGNLSQKARPHLYPLSLLSSSRLLCLPVFIAPACTPTLFSSPRNHFWLFSTGWVEISPHRLSRLQTPQIWDDRHMQPTPPSHLLYKPSVILSMSCVRTQWWGCLPNVSNSSTRNQICSLY